MSATNILADILGKTSDQITKAEDKIRNEMADLCLNSETDDFGSLLSEHIAAIELITHVRTQLDKIAAGEPIDTIVATTTAEPETVRSRHARTSDGKLAKGVLTPAATFRLLILKFLARQTDPVLKELVYKKIASSVRLNRADQEPMPSCPRKRPKWQYAIDGMASKLTKDGYMKKDKGYWSLTAKGRRESKKVK